VTPVIPLKVISAAFNPDIESLKDRVNFVVVSEGEPSAITLIKVTEGSIFVVLDEPLMVYPVFETPTVRSPPLVKPLMGKVYGLLPVSVPLAVTPATPLKVISEVLSPDIGSLKASVNSVVFCEIEPLAVSLSKVTEINGTGAAVTVTVQVAVLLPSSVLTVIVALPTDTPVTVQVKPFDETVATAVLLLLHVTFLFVVLAGVMVAVNASVPPTVIVKDGIGKIMLITLTVTVQVAEKPPSTVVTVIIAVPEATAVTVPFNPLADTVATAVLLLLHVTFLLVALEGKTVAVNASVLPA
jgi:hypothetical protein